MPLSMMFFHARSAIFVLIVHALIAFPAISEERSSEPAMPVRRGTVVGGRFRRRFETPQIRGVPALRHGPPAHGVVPGSIEAQAADRTGAGVDGKVGSARR